MTDKMFNEVAATGVVGALLVLAIIAIIKLYYELKEERQKRLDEKDARIVDAKTYASLLSESQKEIAVITGNLGRVAEVLENEREERLRLERELQFRERHTAPEEVRPLMPLRPGKR